MRRIVHLSDIHVGRVRLDLVDPLVEIVREIAPDLVVVSGDLTQRARNWQFRQARNLLDRFPAPWLCVPGNHDAPLDNLFLRLLAPWRRYRRWISDDLEPEFHDAEMSVVGVNTADPFVWQRGRIGAATLRRVCDGFGDPDEQRVRIAVLHHPLEHAPGVQKRLTRGAAAAVDALSDCNTDVILTGHLHTWRLTPFATRAGRRSALQLQAGSGLSTRIRGEANGFNLLTLHNADKIEVDRYEARQDAARFDVIDTRAFSRTPAGWVGREAEGA